MWFGAETLDKKVDEASHLWRQKFAVRIDGKYAELVGLPIAENSHQLPIAQRLEDQEIGLEHHPKTFCGSTAQDIAAVGPQTTRDTDLLLHAVAFEAPFVW